MKRGPLTNLASRYDLVVIGGGITGAGVLIEAARAGASALLLERGDFASGTSSGSSKLVHGGLRYLKSGQWGLTLESVRERERLLGEAPDLVETQGFLMPIYRGRKPGKLTMRLGLWIYDRMAGTGASRWVDADETLRLEPQLRREGLLGAMLYDDARTNDARLVIALLASACAAGATARNYSRVTALLRDGGRVRGVSVQDAEDGVTRDIEAGVVIDATGAGAGRLQGEGNAPLLRPLRGSHFIFAKDKLPVARAVSWLHPRDQRPVFAYPWEGATLYGTTDLDHEGDGAPRMSAAESRYLIEGLAHQFPELKLSPADAMSSYSAVRPVVAGGKGKPSAESRESALWSAPGLVGVTGGKLTTFRVTARQVLREAARQQSNLAPGAEGRLFPAPTGAALRTQTRWVEDLGLGGTRYSLTKLRWAARHEGAVHLDDLMLRRTPLGLVTPEGGRGLLPRLKSLCAEELGWNDTRWSQEEARYLELWQRNHAPDNGTRVLTA